MRQSYKSRLLNLLFNAYTIYTTYTTYTTHTAYTVFTFVVLFTVSIVSFTVPGYSQTYHCRNYSQKDGLPGTLVSSLCSDADGYLLLATEKGLYRFDGHRFATPYAGKLKDPKVRFLFTDGEGNLWVGTNSNGFQCFAPDGGEPVICPPMLAKHCISAIARDGKGDLWFGTKNGLFRYDGKTYFSYTTADGLPHNYISNLKYHKDRGLCIVTLKGVCLLPNNFSSGGVSKYRFSPLSLPDGFGGRVFLSALVDSNGRLWIGSNSAGLLCLQGDTYTVYTTADGLSNNSITTLMEDGDGRIWVGTRSGVNLFNKGVFIPITIKNGPADDFIYTAMQDHEGNIWIGTHLGATCIHTLNIANFTKQNGLCHNTVYKVFQDSKGRLWFGTNSGLNIYDGDKMQTYTTRNGLPDNSIHVFSEDRNGVVWIGTLGGLATFADKTMRPVPGVDFTIFTLMEAADGYLWIGCDRGVMRLKDKRLYPAPFENKYKDVSTFFKDDDGHLWFSSTNGLHYYDGQKVVDFKLGTVAVPSLGLESIFQDGRGNIWFGGEGVLSRYNKADHSFRHFSRTDGVPDSNCYFILEDDAEGIWVGTANGLAVYDGSRFKSYYSKPHGLAGDYWFTGIKAADGSLWLGGLDGITHLVLPITANKVPPPVCISTIKVLEKDTHTADLAHLHHEQNYFRFFFTGITFTAPETMIYKYKLEGIDAEWRETSAQSVVYPYLPGGSYRFMVKAVNNDGIESTTPAEISFRIPPPFWRTWWFLALVSFAALSLTTLAVMWRYRRAREKAELKAKNRQLVLAQRMELMGNLAAGTVHDLKNLLSIILGYTRIISRKYKPDDEDYHHIKTINTTAGTAVRMSKQILDLARYPDELPGRLNLGELLEDILKTLEVTMPKKINTVWVPPESPVYLAIHPGHLQQLVINLCQNAIHAMPDGGTLTISLKGPENGLLTLTVADTGVGIPENLRQKIFEPLFTTKSKGKGTGLGLFVVKYLIDEYNGDIRVDGKVGEGAAFIIRLPDRSETGSR